MAASTWLTCLDLVRPEAEHDAAGGEGQLLQALVLLTGTIIFISLPRNIRRRPLRPGWLAGAGFGRDSLHVEAELLPAAPGLLHGGQAGDGAVLAVAGPGQGDAALLPGQAGQGGLQLTHHPLLIHDTQYNTRY